MRLGTSGITRCSLGPAPLRRSLGLLRGGSVLIDARRGGGKKTGNSENISEITEKVRKANGKREEPSGAKEPTEKKRKVGQDASGSAGGSLAEDADGGDVWRGEAVLTD